MTFKPVNTHAERCGNRVRLHASPKFVRPDGVTWRSIEEILTVHRDGATGAYRVMCDDQWISFTPRAQHGQLARSVISNTHFGDILTFNSGYDGLIEYDVAHSSRVSHTASGWQFADITDVPLGVFLGDWRGRFVDRVIVRSDRASVDLTGVTADVFGQINLDPVTVDWTSRGGAGQGGDTWADVRSGAGNVSAMEIIVMVDDAAANGDILCVRGACRFDTSGFPAVRSAIFRATPRSFMGNPVTPAGDVHVSRASIASYGVGFVPFDVYPEVKSGYEINPWGLMVSDGGDHTFNLTAHYEATSTFDVGLADYPRDVCDVPPLAPMGVQLTAARLEMVLPGDGLALMGVGK